MKVIYSEKHRRHAPPHQFNVTRMGPYSESPERADRILKALEAEHDIGPPDNHGPTPLLEVHTEDYLRFLKHVYTDWEKQGGSPKGLIPYTYAKRGMNHLPDTLIYQAGHYCFDPQTPIVAGTYQAAKSSADCALTAADLVASGERVVYALCRPPGHHAASALYGGYCYLNNAAIAARHLGDRIAIIDIDYHHGNGTQDIFYEDAGTYFISIHADPNAVYPFFSGSETETGADRGAGTNRNFALPANITGDDYLETLGVALSGLERFEPKALVISAGYDIFEKDPLGDFKITLEGFAKIGETLSTLDLPTVIVQEGGYNTESLGPCAAHFLAGFESG